MLAINSNKKCFNIETKRWELCKDTVRSGGGGKVVPPPPCCITPSCSCLPNACDVFNAMCIALNNYTNAGSIFERIGTSDTPVDTRIFINSVTLGGSPYTFANTICLDPGMIGLSNPLWNGNPLMCNTSSLLTSCYTIGTITNGAINCYNTWVTQCVEIIGPTPSCPTIGICYEYMAVDNTFFPGFYESKFRNAHVCTNYNSVGLNINNCQDCNGGIVIPPDPCDITSAMPISINSTVASGGTGILSGIKINVPVCCADDTLPFTITTTDINFNLISTPPTILSGMLNIFDLYYEYLGPPGVSNFDLIISTPTCGSITYQIQLTVNPCTSLTSDIFNAPHYVSINLDPITIAAGVLSPQFDFYIYVPTCCGYPPAVPLIYPNSANIIVTTTPGPSAYGVNLYSFQLSSLVPGFYPGEFITIAMGPCGKIDYIIDVTIV